MMRHLTHNRLIAWFSVGVWFTLVVFLMLSPGEDTLAEDLSHTFGGTELTDAFGHVILFGVLTALLFHALRLHVPVERALMVATLIGLGVGSTLEPAQFLVYERGAALLDLVANWTGVLLSSGLVRWLVFPSRPAHERVRATRQPDAPESRH